jgi:hypothetical protein
MSLKNLQEISSLVTNSLKLPPFSGVDEGSKYLRLLAGIAENRWEDEAEAREELYGKSLDSRSFDMLKSRAKEHLVNMIFQLDTEKSFKSSYDKAYYRCCKNLLAGTLIYIQGKPKSAKKLLVHSLQVAEKHHFTDLSIVALRHLRRVASFSGSKNDFIEFESNLSSKLNLYKYELDAESMEQDLVLEVLHSGNLPKEFSKKAELYFKKLRSILKQYDSHTLRIHMYRVGFRYFNSIHSFNKTYLLADEAIDYLKQNPLLSQKVRIGEMHLNKMHAALQLRNISAGEKIALQCEMLFNPGHLNWLIYLEIYFLLCLKTKHYKKASNIFLKVVSDKVFDSYPTSRKEQWKIYEAYLHYIYEDAAAEKKKFNLYKFLNEVPIYSRDKAGYNVSILIAQILLLLKEADYDKILSRAESLKVYISRHVKRENSPRTYYFLKMLLVMIKYEFDPEKTEKIAQKFFDRMQERGGNREIEEMEVIPYDILWPQVLQMLKDQEHEHIKPVR